MAAGAGDTWVNADVPEAGADPLHAIYVRIVVKGRSIVAGRLTPAAYSNGLALALPQVGLARPESVGRARTTASFGRLTSPAAPARRPA